MAMTKCKECKAEVSTKAKKCPNCGVSSPGVSGKDMLAGLGGIVVLVLITIVACSPDDKPTEKPATKNPKLSEEDQAAAKKAEMEACRQDLQCWGEEHWAAATNRCEREIERQAQYEVKWTDSYPDTKLTRRGWLDKEAGTLTFYGDRVQFSNRYGAFQNYTYRCDYDPAAKRVINLQMEPGRI